MPKMEAVDCSLVFDGVPVARVKTQGDAKRLAAAWNICKGILTEDLTNEGNLAVVVPAELAKRFIAMGGAGHAEAEAQLAVLIRDRLRTAKMLA